jgi:rhodanese-related sulfurtransferase
MREIEPRELVAWLEASGSDSQEVGTKEPLILDVREDWEFKLCHLPGSLHIPMREIPSRLQELDRTRPVVCLCHHGMRSMQVAMFLEHHGIDEVYNLSGGIDAWARQVDPSCATY